MPITELDHYFIWVKDLEKSYRFYCDNIGLEEMPRPTVELPGYWLGTNGKVQVHMGLAGWTNETEDGDSKVTPTPRGDSVNVDHIGFLATEPERFMKHLRKLGVAARVRYIKSMKLVQIDLQDPDGILVELNFPDIDVEPFWISDGAT